MIHFVIPARKGSKGLPEKNRKLLPIIKENFPKKVKPRMVLTTDDEELIENTSDSNIKIVERPEELAGDDVSIKPVIEHVINKHKFYPSDDIVLLYPTYPERTYKDVRRILKVYQENGAKSLLCCQEPTKNTFSHLLINQDEETLKGEPVFEKNVYRRQDAKGTVEDLGYEPTEDEYEMSHFVAIFKVSEIENLNLNLYNDSTIYYRLDERVIDIDTKEDLIEYENKGKCTQ